MIAACASSHWSLLGVSGALTLALVAGPGCGGKAQTQARVGPLASEGGIKVDRTRCDERGKQVQGADTNNDQKRDVTKLYEVRDQGGQKTQVLACKQVDVNYDDKVDIVYHYDPSGAVSFEEFDLDFDGRFDLWSYYQSGTKVREEKDMNYDRRPDYVEHYEGGKIVRVERDTNNDGRVDQWEYYEGGKLDRIGYDTTGSGRADKWDRSPEEPAGGASESGGAPPPPAAPPGSPPPAGVAPPPVAAPPAPVPAPAAVKK